MFRIVHGQKVALSLFVVVLAGITLAFSFSVRNAVAAPKETPPSCGANAISPPPSCSLRPGEAFIPEGFGAVTRGGEGGRVIWVTTLQPDGPGSFREALDAEGPRIIKFSVAGKIVVPDEWGNKFWVGWPHRRDSFAAPGGPANYDSPQSYVTIDGASAPDPGITITNGGILIGYGVHDVIIRHLTIRVGSIGSATGDGISLNSVKRILVDHVTITDAEDEALDAGGSEDVTVQWSILGPGATCCHVKGFDHSSGLFIAYGSTRVTVHHNLFAKNRLRNPLFYGDTATTYTDGSNPIVDMRNNLIFGTYQHTVIGAGMHANLVGNLYIDPTPLMRPVITLVASYAAPPLVYLDGNYALPLSTDPMYAVMDAFDYTRYVSLENMSLTTNKAFKAPHVRTQPVLEAAAAITNLAGARPWMRGVQESNLTSGINADSSLRNATPQLLESTQPTQ